MDLRTRYISHDETLQELADAVQSRIFTMIPVKVIKDSDGHTVALKPLIKVTQRLPDGSTKVVEMPEIQDAPVNFASGGGTTFTHPIKEGDEGFAMIASRSLDAWHQQGGVQPQIDARMHDLSDAVYVPGLKSTPNKIQKYNKDAAEIRSNDGKHKVALHPKDGIAMSVEDGKHTMTMHPKNGIAASVDDGKHTFNMTPQAGIALKTAMKLAVDASSGLNFKGPLSVDGLINATGNIGSLGNVLGKNIL